MKRPNRMRGWRAQGKARGKAAPDAMALVTFGSFALTVMQASGLEDNERLCRIHEEAIRLGLARDAEVAENVDDRDTQAWLQ